MGIKVDKVEDIKCTIDAKVMEIIADSKKAPDIILKFKGIEGEKKIILSELRELISDLDSTYAYIENKVFKNMLRKDKGVEPLMVDLKFVKPGIGKTNGV